ncbi:hypothetical protein, partial [Enterococcus faecium]|uniref:hypothetical protein n=1 Tax=Enterococcus faecium TaxID=1352 RepID=UPI0029310953
MKIAVNSCRIGFITRLSTFAWTPKYTYYGGTIYSNETGEAITEPTEEVQNEIDSLKEKVDKQL